MEDIFWLKKNFLLLVSFFPKKNRIIVSYLKTDTDGTSFEVVSLPPVQLMKPGIESGGACNACMQQMTLTDKTFLPV